MSIKPLFTYLVLLLVMTHITGCSKKTDTANDEADIIVDDSNRNISSTTNNSSNPKISADSLGNVYITWEEAYSDSGTEVYLADSINSGSSFNKRNLSIKEGCTVSGHAGDVDNSIGGNGSLHTVWSEDWSSDGKYIKYYNNELFSCKFISYLSRDASSPVIKSGNNGHLFSVWEEDTGGQKKDIFFRHSENEGSDFTPSLGSEPLNISNSAADSSDPMLGVMEGSLNSNIDVVWVEGSEGGRSIAISSSSDNGTNFTSPAHMISDAMIDSYCPAMYFSENGRIYIAYKGDTGIYFIIRKSSASAFSIPLKISSSDSVSPSCPEIGVGSNGVIYAVWSDNGEIWVTESTDEGGTFFNTENISSSAGQSSSPKLAMDGSYINVVWVEEDTGNGDIYFSGSIDNGMNFSSPVNISDTTDVSGSPVIAVDGKEYLFIAWEEGEDAGREIYFIRDKGARALTKQAGKSLAQFMDINGDGKSDILIGAPADQNGSINGSIKGKVYLYFGSDSLSPTADLTFSEGSEGDQFGASIAIAGDINGDGYSDIIAGAPSNDDNAMNSGMVNIYYGNKTSLMDTTPDIVIKGLEENDYAGYAISSAGDVNHDGFDDIIIGLPEKAGATPYSGKAVIFYGGPNMGSKTNYPVLSINDADIMLNGVNSGDKFGSAVSRGGDFNNDGFDDVAVSAPFAGDSNSKKGMVYIFFGGDQMNSKADVQLTGEYNIDKIGTSLAGGSDINGDGYSDVIIGAPDADLVSDSYQDDEGKVYVIYGFDSNDGTLKEIDLGNTSYKITVLKGEKYKEFFGTSVRNAGDFDGDTYADVIVGKYYIGTDTSYKDKAVLYYGGPAMDSTSVVTLSDNKHEDGFGAAVAGAGDVDGDGYYDVLVGAPFADGGGTDRGRVYLYRGNTIPDTDTDSTFTGTIDNGWAGFSLYRTK